MHKNIKIRTKIDSFCFDQKIERIIEYLRLSYTNKSRCAYIGCQGVANLGDIELYKATKQALTQNMALVSFRSDWLPNIVKTLRSPPVFNTICLGGGTLIGRKDNRLHDAIKAGLSAFSFGTGCHDPQFLKKYQFLPDSHFHRWIETMKQIDLVSVRGEISKSILKKYGLNQNIHVIGDPVLIFANSTFEDKAFKKRIGINLGGWNLKSTMWGKMENVRNVFEKVINSLINEGWKVTFFPLYWEEYYDLYRFAKKINQNIRVVRSYKNRNLFFRECKKQSLFIGMRLHSIVLAHCVNVPAVMIAYQPKGYDYMLTMNMGKYIHRSDKIDADNVLSSVEESINCWKNIKIELKKQIEIFRLRREQYIKSIFKWVDDFSE